MWDLVLFVCGLVIVDFMGCCLLSALFGLLALLGFDGFGGVVLG